MMLGLIEAVIHRVGGERRDVLPGTSVIVSKKNKWTKRSFTRDDLDA